MLEWNLPFYIYIIGFTVYLVGRKIKESFTAVEWPMISVQVYSTGQRQWWVSADRALSIWQQSGGGITYRERGGHCDNTGSWPDTLVSYLVIIQQQQQPEIQQQQQRTTSAPVSAVSGVTAPCQSVLRSRNWLGFCLTKSQDTAISEKTGHLNAEHRCTWVIGGECE